MNLHLQRTERSDRYTMGRLAIDGEPFCDTLEPTDRHLDAITMRPEQKLYGQADTGPPGNTGVRHSMATHTFAFYSLCFACNSFPFCTLFVSELSKKQLF